MFDVRDGLGSELVLQLGGGYGDAIDAEDQVERLVVLGAVVKLAGEGEAVGVVVLFRVGIHAVGGAEEGEGEVLAEEIDAVAEDVKRAAGVHGAGDFFEEHGLGVLAVVVGDDFPLGGLRFADEGKEDGGIEGKGAVEVFGVGFGVAVVGEMVLDGFFELDFAVVNHACTKLLFSENSRPRVFLESRVSSSNAPIDTAARANGKHADDPSFFVNPVDDAVGICAEPHPVRILIPAHFEGTGRHGIGQQVVDHLAGLPHEGAISELAQIAFGFGFQDDLPVTGGHTGFSRLPRRHTLGVWISSAGSHCRFCPAPLRKHTAVCFYL
jgi:hypothetical protein